MLKWLCRKFCTIYVPLAGDGVPYEKKWDDREYLRGLVAFGNNEYFKTEMLRGLKLIRDVADRAKTPDELSGCNAGISIIKNILTAPARAKALLDGYDG